MRAPFAFARTRANLLRVKVPISHWWPWADHVLWSSVWAIAHTGMKVSRTCVLSASYHVRSKTIPQWLPNLIWDHIMHPKVHI